jgi:hypothetical protein
MSFIDRIRDLFGRNKSAAAGTAATTGAVVASTSGDHGRDADEHGSGSEGTESGGGWDLGGGDGSGGGDGGGGGS